MIELTVLQYLTDTLDLPAYMERPTYPPPSYLVLEKVGGSETDKIATAMLAIQSYAPTLPDAARLNRRVKQAMAGLAALDEIASVSLNSDYNFTDPATKAYRYQAVYDMTYYDEDGEERSE